MTGLDLDMTKVCGLVPPVNDLYCILRSYDPCFVFVFDILSRCHDVNWRPVPFLHVINEFKFCSSE